MKRRIILTGMLLAVLAGTAGCGGGGQKLDSGPTSATTSAPGSEAGRSLAEAAYPAMAAYPMEAEFTDANTGEFDDEGFFKAYDQWWLEKRALSELPEAGGSGMEAFTKKSVRQFLTESGNENRVYSPVNVYLALAMLAETTDGDSRNQILELLGADSVKEMRARAANIWKLNYRDDGAVTSILANSLWLRDDMEYHQKVLDLLAKEYYASSYSGSMGSEEYDKMLQNWLNEQTGGLLKEQAAGIKMNERTAMALASTILYRAKWKNEFQEANTKEAVFHGNEQEITCEFMNSSQFGSYYWSDHFSAVSLSLGEGGEMWLMLPDESSSVDDLLADDAAFEFIHAPQEWPNGKYLEINLSMPKFDVVSDLDLRDGLKKLGVTDVFEMETADFSPLTDDSDLLYLSKAQHAARVKVDEKGVEAAAYTVMMAEAGAAMPEEKVDFVLDRPFLFLITSEQGFPLFTGVVNRPAEQSGQADREAVTEGGAVPSEILMDEEAAEAESGKLDGSTTEPAEFHESDVYVTGNPLLSDCLFLKCSLSSVKQMEATLAETVSPDETYGGHFTYWAGDQITYVSHSAMDGNLYGVILSSDQFELGCGLKVGMSEAEIGELSLPFELIEKEYYPMDSLYPTDSGCPLQTVDYDAAYLYQFGQIPEGVETADSILSGGRISITALVKDGVVVNVFTNIPVAG